MFLKLTRSNGSKTLINTGRLADCSDLDGTTLVMIAGRTGFYVTESLAEIEEMLNACGGVYDLARARKEAQEEAEWQAEMDARKAELDAEDATTQAPAPVDRFWEDEEAP